MTVGVIRSVLDLWKRMKRVWRGKRIKWETRARETRGRDRKLVE